MTADPSTDEVSIVCGGVKWGGWTAISVTRGLEIVPSTFDFQGTEKYPDGAGSGEVPMLPSTPCTILFGSDVILSGYVDGLDFTIGPNEHWIHVLGRSKIEDLVDCSGMLDQNEAQNCTIGSISKLICDPLGISVSLPDGDTEVIKVYSASVIESGYEQLARYAQMYAKLLYDDTNGNLVIANVGTTAHASGFQEGVNVLFGQSTRNASERYTSIAAVWSDTQVLVDGGTAAPNYFPGAKVVDDSANWQPRSVGGARNRPLIIIADMGAGGDPNVLVPQRVKWEMARRIGRSQCVQITCDSWRDSAGKLWTPNQLANVNCPSLKISNQNWIIASVTFIRDAGGTRADVTLMPKEAFVPAPVGQFFVDPVVAASTDPQATSGAQTPSK